MHPQWHTEFWPENLPRQTSQDEMEMVQDEVVIEEPEPICDDFDWCEETSNCGDIILEQDIPYQSEVVTATATEDDESNKQNVRSTQTTANIVKPTNPRSLLKVSYITTAQRPVTKFKKTLVVNKSLLKSNYRQLNQSDLQTETEFRKPQSVSPKSLTSNRKIKEPPKFLKTIKVKRDEVFQSKKMKKLSKQLKERSRHYKTDRNSSTKTTNSVGGKGKIGKREHKFVNLDGENITINHDVESGSSLDPRRNVVVFEDTRALPIKNDSESDLEIDIESDAEIPLPIPSIKIKVEEEDSDLPVEIITKPKNDESIDGKPYQDEKEADVKIVSKFREYPAEIADLVESLDVPTKETRLNLSEVTELEKYFHSEFFEGRPTKTPERYLKIRAYIINTWHECKPQYVSKTAVRTGLKHCGDVNCISRIHCLLEQIGAINFSPNGDHITYVRPLIKLIEIFAQPRQNVRNTKLVEMGHEKRQRIKSGNSDNTEIDANFTVSHDDGRLVFHSNGHAKNNSEQPRRTRVTVKPEFHLIQCCRFGKDKLAPFKVSITLSTLLCMQLHSLSSKHEVMGFLGGHQSKSVERNKLNLTRYKPCQTSEQSGTMCEMCPGKHFIIFHNFLNISASMLIFERLLSGGSHKLKIL